MADQESSFRYTGDVAAMKAYLTDLFGHSTDLQFRELHPGGTAGLTALLCYLDQMIDVGMLNEHLVEPLLRMAPTCAAAPDEAVRLVRSTVTSVIPIAEAASLENAIKSLLDGQAILLVAGSARIIIAGLPHYPARSVEKPETEHAVRGSREAFTEVLAFNIAMVRRRVRDPRLRVERLSLGVRGRTDLAVLHVEGITNPAIVEAVRKRLNAITIDEVMESHTVEELIRD
jgi:hypothetical protein